MIMVDGIEREIDEKAIDIYVEQTFSKYPKEQREYIKYEVRRLIDDLDFDSSLMYNRPPEHYYTQVIEAYLFEHSFDDLYCCADDLEIFDYCF